MGSVVECDKITAHYHTNYANDDRLLGAELRRQLNEWYPLK